jgi:hypothetical protein
VVPLMDMLAETAMRTGCLQVLNPIGTRSELDPQQLFERPLLVIYAYGTGTAHYGLRFEVVRREVDGRSQGLLEHLDAMPNPQWPGIRSRWCTSDHKRGPIRRLMTRLARELRDSGRPAPVASGAGWDRPAELRR